MYIYNKIPETPKKPTGVSEYMVNEAETIKSFDHNNIFRYKEFEESMKYFDTSDNMTRAILLAVNEADQGVIMTSLSNKLYKHIVDKVDDIDFGTIPSSMGDITKIDNYDNLVDCINIIGELLQNYHQPTDSIETVQIALQNMIDRKELFTKAYKLNVEMPIIIYNTITLSIISAVSYLISACVEFIKLPEDQGFEIALDRAAVGKVKDHLLFKNLDKFNRCCDRGDFDKAMDYIIKQNTNSKEIGGTLFALSASSVAIILGMILLIIPIIRELIFFFYYSRTRVSDYFEAQASLLTMNAYNIENNFSKEEKNKKEIAKKQNKIASIFKTISNKFKVNIKTSEKKTTDDINKLDKEKYKANEVLDKTPDSAASVLF